MADPTARFIEVIENDIAHGEEAAKGIDELIPYLVGEDQKEQWRGFARAYRAQAEGMRELLEKVRKT